MTWDQLRHLHRHPQVIALWRRLFEPLLRWLQPNRRRWILASGALVVALKQPIDTVRRLSRMIEQPFGFNQIAGGKAPACTFGELKEAGAKLVICSTPCLFAAMPAIEAALAQITSADGSLAGSPIGVKERNSVLQENLARRTSPRLIMRPSDDRE